ncbi:hypothetical protein EDF81_0199 [Enterobacter sp. BIGb0383]|uniref:hypothetical protein n=1 Tax=unclassified Enterobacter TaxID=2608935 RepID=UPI000F497885|nr:MULTISPECIES: hypothetical protein [unclassified Enterobacter]ROP61725.1 hypothetical protein EDF81_0199 [Enterobacter sp. BIGb0383]ROS11886.1 hypothetical protein EC848_0199 [Enterobacter sp. BIGb0359]
MLDLTNALFTSYPAWCHHFVNKVAGQFAEQIGLELAQGRVKLIAERLALYRVVAYTQRIDDVSQVLACWKKSGTGVKGSECVELRVVAMVAASYEVY